MVMDIQPYLDRITSYNVCYTKLLRDVFPYLLKAETRYDTIETFHDSYSFLPTLTEFDIYLFNAGDHHHIYEKLGSHFVV